ncbi:glutamate receptor ionotropic: kainate 2-like protein [Leptotrombidium deliense]|uniref:Glutamate receptor ionotropic: kainate 2-like protein n=1 Tax=Leptotrombidium deliense TaxID=299467 RepID=A0A443SFR5_9ACAR|nr:glutamate receptor ionotropic: kainate 2-like protein [Leptotrombidium deliense]
MYIASLCNVFFSVKTQKFNNFGLNSIKELVNEKKINYFMIKEGATETFFKESKIFEYRKIYENVEKNNNFVLTKENGFNKVVNNENNVFISEQVIIMNSNDHNSLSDCELMSLDNSIIERGFGIATEIGSHLGLMLNQVLLDLQSEGILDDLKQKWFNNDNNLCDVTKHDFVES